MIYSSRDIEHDRLTLVILGIFLPFYPLKTPKNQTFEKWKNCRRFHDFTHVHQKSQSYVRFLRYGVRETKCFVILDHFLPFYPTNNPQNQNFEKMKKMPGDIIGNRSVT